MVDLGKLSFGSLILGSILRGGFDPLQTFIGGVTIAIALFVGCSIHPQRQGVKELFMEMLIIFVGIVVPFAAVVFYAMYRENKEKRKEQTQ